MKTLIFITLKILEIVGVVSAYFLIAFIGYLIGLWLNNSGVEYNMFGFVNFMLGLISAFLPIMLIVLTSFAIRYLFPLWIDKNKEWTRNIYNKLKK